MENKIYNNIKRIPKFIINQIAAGEIVDRPSSIIKELIENSIDSNATQIRVSLLEAGKSKISVIDNGDGISKEDLPMAIEAHATSKLNTKYDLFDINTLGFRGEALTSISNISRTNITSRFKDSDLAYKLKSEGSKILAILPAELKIGTSVEVLDIFFSVPARLKFLKSFRTELSHCIKIFQSLALSNPKIAFELFSENKLLYKYEAKNNLKERLLEILKEDANNFFELKEEHEKFSIEAITSIPNLNKPDSSHIFCFVNGRFIQNKFINKAIKNAYNDLIPSNNYPVAALFLTLPNKDIDVNVHPAKTEIKFLDPFIIQKSITNIFSKKILDYASRSNINLANEIIKLNYKSNAQRYNNINTSNYNNTYPKQHLSLKQNTYELMEKPAPYISQTNNIDKPTALNFGEAIFQFSNKYIISKKENEIFIIDQHAANERIVYEKLKKEYFNSGIKSQKLLIPEIISMEHLDIELLLSYKDYFKSLGLIFEKIDKEHIVINTIPALIKDSVIADLIETLISEIREFNETTFIQEKVKKILATFACHNSIRAGKSLSIQEMNALLRSLESIDQSAECNHGRPSYCKFTLNDLDKLFERI